MKRLRMIAMAAVAPLTLGAFLAPQTASAAVHPDAPAVSIGEIFYNPPGRDSGSNASLNAEWVELDNNSGSSVTVTHWTLHERKGNRTYKFGTYHIPAHSFVLVHTGRGRNAFVNVYWKRHGYAWSNTGDTAVLRNAHGAVKDRCSYSDPGSRHLSKDC